MKLAVTSKSPGGVFWRAGLKFTTDEQIVDVTEAQAALIQSEKLLFSKVIVEAPADPAPALSEPKKK